MKKRRLRKIWLGSIGLFVFLLAVLVIHVYLVTRPHAPGPNTRVMARIDLRQPLVSPASSQITSWLYQQKGIDHVMVNPNTGIVIFTYFPARADANELVKNFKAALHYDKAIRYIPTQAELNSGCPVAATSLTYKLYRTIKNIF